MIDTATPSTFEVTDERFRLLAASSPVGIFQADTAGRLVYANPRWLEITGLVFARAEGMPWHSILQAGSEARVAQAVRRTTENKDELFMRYQMHRSDGTTRWVHVRAAPLHEDDGTFYGYVGSLADVTEQVEGEAERNRLNEILEATTDLVVVTDARGWLSYLNHAGRQMLGIESCGSIDRTHALRFYTPTSVAQIRLEVIPAIVNHGIWNGELELLRVDGTTLPVSQVTIGHHSADGTVEYVSTVCRDITQRKRMAAELERRAAQQASVAHLGQHALGGAEVDYLITEVVTAIDRTLCVDGACFFDPYHELGHESSGGFLVRAAVGVFSQMTGLPLAHGDLSQQALATLASSAPELIEALSDDGDTLYQTASVPVGDVEHPYGVLCARSAGPNFFSSDDIHFLQSVANVLATAIGRKRTDEEILHRALHDSLTGLPNRTLLMDRLEWALARSRRREGDVAVFFLDLDDFKMVNDGLGHTFGDELLRSVADRLVQALRPGDTVARFGGDEFVVVCEDVAGDDDAHQIAERISMAISEQYRLGDREVFATSSIGISIARDADTMPETLLADADTAMYRAKTRGRARFELFDEALRHQSMSRLETINSLRRALDRAELELHYQPVISLAANGDGGEGRIVAVEALMRWQHPQRGLILPAEFVTEAEETGLIVPLGRWVLEQACMQAALWQHGIVGAGDLGIAVNLSARQFADPELPSIVEAAIRQSCLDPGALCLEITENVIMEDAGVTTATLHNLKTQGVRIVIDDFGTGYSSLSYLRRLPVDLVKIDRSFIDRLGKDAGDLAIVTAIISMAHALGLKVVAEGVETDAQAAELRKLGCDYAQGFLVSLPLSSVDLESTLRLSSSQYV